LAGLLVSEGYRTTWTDRVVLVPEDEARLTAWMHAHLRLTWAEDAEPATVEAEMVGACTRPVGLGDVQVEAGHRGSEPQRVHRSGGGVVGDDVGDDAADRQDRAVSFGSRGQTAPASRQLRRE
jgi:hypothetical protein